MTPKQKLENEMRLQLGFMWFMGRKWLKEHPQADVSVGFHFPPGGHVIMAISEGVKKKLVTANQDGMDLMKSLWRWDVRSEPSVTMMRVVLDSLKEEQEPDLLLRVKKMVSDFCDQHPHTIFIQI